VVGLALSVWSVAGAGTVVLLRVGSRDYRKTSLRRILTLRRRHGFSGDTREDRHSEADERREVVRKEAGARRPGWLETFFEDR